MSLSVPLDLTRLSALVLSAAEPELWYTIEWEAIASAFNTIIPSSGYTYPNEPLPPAAWFTAVVFILEVPSEIEPLTTLNLLCDALIVESAVAPLSSMSFNRESFSPDVL